MLTKVPPRPAQPDPVRRPPPGPSPSPPASLIYWPAVATAGGLALALLGVLAVWVALHPASEATVEVAVPPPAPPIPQAEPPAPVVPLAAPQAPAAEVEKTLVPEPSPPKDTPVRPTAVDQRPPAPPRLPEEPNQAPPPEPPPAEPKQQVAGPPEPMPARPAGETYGTSVLFLNNPEQAARIAKQEAKLLFVLHVSGNFEDSCFT